jgi:hypothetical protein
MSWDIVHVLPVVGGPGQGLHQFTDEFSGAREDSDVEVGTRLQGAGRRAAGERLAGRSFGQANCCGNCAITPSETMSASMSMCCSALS